MGKTSNFIVTSLLSFFICSLMLLSVMLCLFLPDGSDNTPYKTAQKTESTIPYSYSADTKNAEVLISLENCPVDFLVKLSPKAGNVSVKTAPNNSLKDKSLKYITFNVSGFENMINYLGGIEIETPYGLPNPAKNKKIIAKDELLTVYGASLGEILNGEPQPSIERKSYYCYIVEKICIAFLTDCTPERYKFLKQNCETNISYTEFYDSYKSLKNIKD